jgi:hypothetical protein
MMWKIGGIIEYPDNFNTRKGEVIYVDGEQVVIEDSERGLCTVWARNCTSVWPRGAEQVRRWSHKMSTPEELSRIRGLRARYFRDNSQVRQSRELQSMVEAVKKVFS